MASLESINQSPSKAAERLEEGNKSANEAGFKSLDLLKEGRNVRQDRFEGKELPPLTLVEDKPKQEHKSSKEKVVTELKHFGEGLATGIALAPINGVTQLFNHIFHTHIGKIQFHDQAEVDKSIAGKIGKFAGGALSTAAVGVATGGVSEVMGLTGKAAIAADAAATAAVKGGVLTPTDENNGHFWRDRLENAATGAAKGLLPKGQKAALETTMKAGNDIGDHKKPLSPDKTHEKTPEKK